MRLCLGCRATKPKKELIRIVRTPSGTIELDWSGKKAGRGAYICPNEDCLDLAVKAKSLEKALEQSLSPEVLAALRQALQDSGNRRVAPSGPDKGLGGSTGVMG